MSDRLASAALLVCIYFLMVAHIYYRYMLADTSFDGSFSVCETQACIENAYHKIFARILIHDSDLKIEIEIEINQIIKVISKY